MSEAFDRLVEVMDTLRSPGGCPWDAEQTHRSLAPYALEEVYELLDAIENGSRADLREELGDVLLQVVFHARVAQEHAEEPFGIDEVVRTLTAKLQQRHPHVFADATAASARDVESRWNAIKKDTQGRDSVFDGIPRAQPALARAQKVLSRAARESLAVPELDGLGGRLMALVAEADGAGVDAEGALRDAVQALEASLREQEAASVTDHSSQRDLGRSATREQRR